MYPVADSSAGEMTLLPAFSEKISARVRLLLTRKITLRLPKENILLFTTTLQELGQVLSAGLTTSITRRYFYGSAVQYIMDGKYEYSEAAGFKLGGPRPVPGDFDFCIESPEASSYARWKSVTFFTQWCFEKISRENPGYIKNKSRFEAVEFIRHTIFGTLWNEREEAAENRYLLLALKDSERRKYEIRITSSLKVPSLCSSERIQIDLDLRLCSAFPTSLVKDWQGIITEWNRGEACLLNIDALDPFAWIKVVSKMTKGIRFPQEQLQAITSRALTKEIWEGRNILCLEDLLLKGLADKAIDEQIVFLFIALNLLEDKVPFPRLDLTDETFQKGLSIKDPLLGWIALNGFHDWKQFKEKRDLLAHHIHLCQQANLRFPERFKIFVADNQFVLRLGKPDITKRKNPPYLMIPFPVHFSEHVREPVLTQFFCIPSPEEVFQNKEYALKEAFQSGHEEDFLRLLEGLDLNKISTESCHLVVQFYLKHALVCPPIRDKAVFILQAATALFRDEYYEQFTGDLIGLELLENYKIPVTPVIKNYLKTIFSPELSCRILAVFGRQAAKYFILNDLKIPCHGPDDFLFRLGVTAESFESLHYLEIFYSETYQARLFSPMDARLKSLAALIEMFPHGPEWLQKEIDQFIRTDIDDFGEYFHFWCHELPVLFGNAADRDKLDPSLSIDRFVSFADFLLEKGETKHSIRLFSLLGKTHSDFIAKLQPSPYAFFMKALDKINFDNDPSLDNTLYVFESLLDALKGNDKFLGSTNKKLSKQVYFQAVFDKLLIEINRVTSQPVYKISFWMQLVDILINWASLAQDKKVYEPKCPQFAKNVREINSQVLRIVKMKPCMIGKDFIDRFKEAVKGNFDLYAQYIPPLEAARAEAEPLTITMPPCYLL